jgi:hypothetical protein
VASRWLRGAVAPQTTSRNAAAVTTCDINKFVTEVKIYAFELHF